MANEVPKYTKVLLEKVRRGDIQAPVGEVTQVEVLHDDWCTIWVSGVCICDPEVKAL